MAEFQISLNTEAAKEFVELQRNNALGGLAERYLRELRDFPPAAWGDIHQLEGKSYFKSDNHVIFDIQGKVILDVRGLACGVRITRFRLRRGK